MRLIENPFKNLVSATGQGQIHHLCYRPEEEAKAVILLIHGMCEHQGRYREFAEFLTGYNFIVYSLDLPGHGKTAKKEDLGFFAKKAGYQKVIKDVDRYIELISLEHPDLPFILLGHSMGSMIARYYLINRPKLPHAAIFCGTVGPNFMSYFGLIFAMFCAFLLGPTSQGKLQNYLLQKAMKNKEFYDKAVRKYNWISRNKESFYSYINDPDRSFVFTHSA